MTHHQGKGSLPCIGVQEVRKHGWGLGASLAAPKCTRQITGSLTYSQFGRRVLSGRLFPPQWPTFTFPSNYTSWYTLIYSEITCIVSKMWEKKGKETQSPRSRKHWPLQVWHEGRYSLPFFRATNYITVSPQSLVICFWNQDILSLLIFF